jgi:hypothetical protein
MSTDWPPEDWQRKRPRLRRLLYGVGLPLLILCLLGLVAWVCYTGYGRIRQARSMIEHNEQRLQTRSAK